MLWMASWCTAKLRTRFTPYFPGHTRMHQAFDERIGGLQVADCVNGMSGTTVRLSVRTPPKSEIREVRLIDT
jgi:hypothetical protein